MDYSPDFEMNIQAGNRPDLNKDEELMDICSRVAGILGCVSISSVGLHSTLICL